MRVIHLPTNVGNVANTLSEEMKLLGFRSSTLVLYEDNRFETPDKVVARRSDSGLQVEIRKLIALRYLFEYDVVIFNFGSTLFNPAAIGFDSNRLSRMGISKSAKVFLLEAWRLYTSLMQSLELFVLRARRTRIVTIYQGDDVRPGKTEAEMNKKGAQGRGPSQYFDKNVEYLKAKQVEKMSKSASAIFALNPDLLEFLPSSATFLPYMNISPRQLTPHYPAHSSTTIRIAHAPTSRDAKGTHFIISAINQLMKKGRDIQFDLIENRSHMETLRAIRECDLFVDQLVVGWYGGVAVEAMALGKPVICHIDSDQANKIGEMGRDLPFIIATPNTIKKVIEGCVDCPDGHLRNLGVRARAFVERWHNPSTIAREIQEVILGMSKT